MIQINSSNGKKRTSSNMEESSKSKKLIKLEEPGENVNEKFRELYEVIKDMKGATYFMENNPDDYHPRKFVLSFGTYARTNPGATAKHYNDLMLRFQDCSSLEHREYAIRSKKLNKKSVKYFCDSPQDAEVVVVGLEDVQVQSDSRDQVVVPFSSSQDSQGSSSSSSGRTSEVHTLSSSSLEIMNERFQRNFQFFSGSSWTLTNGICFDDVLFNETILLRKESSLHSFVVDSQRSKLLCRLFPDDYDGAIQERLKEMDNHDSFKLEDWQRKVIEAFDSTSTIDKAIFEGINSIVSIDGAEPNGYKEFSKTIFFFFTNIAKFYSENGSNNKLSEGMLERLYMGLWSIFFNMLVDRDDGPIKLKVGEIFSVASAQRRNSERNRDNRQANGRKIDAIFYSNIGSNFEVGAVEAGRKDNSGYGTKELEDSVKISKVMKDMLDFVCIGASINGNNVSEEKKKIEVYGFLVSGLSIEFLSLKYLGGRYFYLNREKREILPDRLTDISFLKIRRILIEFLELKIRMESTVKLLDELVNGPGSRSNQAYQISPTLTTPPPSPKPPSKKVKLTSRTLSSNSNE
ncbi:hypothetical protein BGZ76_004327 [Entomortierella beljakovae]|nr:hypothetical protein BGZ76_004327 [Entomortierella beljakovae]